VSGRVTHNAEVYRLAMRRAGAVIFPPVPAYYIRPKSLQDLTDQTVGRMLDACGWNTGDELTW
jgi:4-hydroxy-3-polyprenylbenzoate decarboxylase